MATGIEDRFPVGSRVRATNSYGEVRVGMIGTVMETENSDSVHVNWGEGFRGHSIAGDIHNGHCYYVGEEYLELVSVPSDLPPVIVGPAVPARIPRVRVTITRNPHIYGTPWTPLIENGPSVTKDEVKQYLDKSIVRRIGRRIWSHGNLEMVVDRAINTYGVDPQVMIDAIMAAVLAKQAREATGSFSSEVYDEDISKAMMAQPMIVAIGNQIFTLQPKGHINATRAMTIVRERVAKSAKESGERIKKVAKTEADGIISNAERQLRDARLKIEEERKALKMAMVIPPWVAANHLKLRNYDSEVFPLAVGMDIDTKITSWQLLRYETDDKGHMNGFIVKWQGDTIPKLAHYHSITVWLPFNPMTGKFHYPKAWIDEPAAIDTQPFSLPHIEYRCCMELQGMPDKMTDYKEYRTVKDIITRGNREVNLNSLLTSVNTWHPDVYNQMPVNIKRLLCGYNGTFYTFDNAPADLIKDAVKTPVSDEAKETFSVDRLREVRRARGDSQQVEYVEHIEDMLIETDTEDREETV